MKFQIIPFRVRHVKLIRPDASDDMMALALAAERSGRAYTACLVGDPIGAAGVWMHGQEGQVWTLFSPLIKRQPVQLYKLVREKLEEVTNEFKPRLLYARCIRTDPQAVRFLQRLGFDIAPYDYYERKFSWS